ncbi:Rrf2 family transcriptional regulator [Vagococcus sp.]|uniref:Rrf2 family transcriptional regulator n=1 Tax=Vagococcus sp. TaxID=1933889 RepID=UPI003F94B445
MKLTNATEQALAIMAILTTQTQGIPASSMTLYQKLEMSPSYIQKLLRKLVVAKIIEGVSGNSGGFYLKKEIKDITLLDVVEAIEGPLKSLPDCGFLERAFTDFNKIAQNGDVIISDYFRKADQAWNKELAEIKVEEIINKIFINYQEIPKHNWNQLVGEG